MTTPIDILLAHASSLNVHSLFNKLSEKRDYRNAEKIKEAASKLHDIIVEKTNRQGIKNLFQTYSKVRKETIIYNLLTYDIWPFFVHIIGLKTSLPYLFFESKHDNAFEVLQICLAKLDPANKNTIMLEFIQMMLRKWCMYENIYLLDQWRTKFSLLFPSEVATSIRSVATFLFQKLINPTDGCNFETVNQFILALNEKIGHDTLKVNVYESLFYWYFENDIDDEDKKQKIQTILSEWITTIPSESFLQRLYKTVFNTYAFNQEALNKFSVLAPSFLLNQNFKLSNDIFNDVVTTNADFVNKIAQPQEFKILLQWIDLFKNVLNFQKILCNFVDYVYKGHIDEQNKILFLSQILSKFPDLLSTRNFWSRKQHVFGCLLVFMIYIAIMLIINLGLSHLHKKYRYRFKLQKALRSTQITLSVFVSFLFIMIMLFWYCASSTKKILPKRKE